MSLLGYDKLRRLYSWLCISTPKLNILCARVGVLLACEKVYMTASLALHFFLEVPVPSQERELFVGGIHFISFYYFSIEFWNWYFFSILLLPDILI